MAAPRLTRMVDGLAVLAPRRPTATGGVAVISSGGLGDTVLFALVAERFRALAGPGEACTLILRADARPMAFLMPPGMRVEAVDYRRLGRDPGYRLATLKRMTAAGYRLVASADYLRHPDLDEALVKAARAPEAVAMEPRPWPKHDRALGRNRRLYTRLFDSGPPRRDKVLRWVAFADWLAGERQPPPRVSLAAGRLAPPARLEAPTVILQPFSAVAGKQSPPELYRRIIAALPPGTRVQVTGTPGDLERAPGVAQLLDPPRVTFNGATFEALVPILRAARLVVSVDTALMHLAVAAGAPTLGLASAAFVGEIVPSPPETAPANAHVLFHDMPCAGCLGACILPAERGMFPCVARLDGDAVVAKVRELVEGRGRLRCPKDTVA